MIRNLLLLVVFVTLLGCSPASPIAEVTPFVLESAEIDTPESVNVVSTEPTQVPPPTPQYTPIPIEEDIQRGETLAVARATDMARNFTPANPEQFDVEPFPVVFDDFYKDYDPYSPAAPQPSFRLLSLDGKTITMEGYMAPPLKLGLDWFMLTRFPVGACPYHSSTATWTPDIVLVYVDGEEMPFTYEPIRVTGELHIGGTVDPETGMASLVRIYATADGVESLAFESR